jgi:hypothetical protein
VNAVPTGHLQMLGSTPRATPAIRPGAYGRAAALTIRLSSYLAPAATAALILGAPASAAVAPGQRLADYLAVHARAGDRAMLVGVSLDGGHAAVVDGRTVARGVTAVVHTRLPDTRAGSFAAQRLCAVASVAVKRLGLKMVAAVEVRARDGAARATSIYLGLPVCHRIA